MLTPPRRAPRPDAFTGTRLDGLLGQGGGGGNQAVALPGVAEGSFVVTIDGVLSIAECSELIAMAEALEFVPAKLNVGGGVEVYSDVRRSGRVIIDSEPFSHQLWERLRGAVPAVLRGRPAVGLNERIRILRYRDAGDAFAAHQDGHYARSNGSAASLLTVLVYLNDGAEYEGARTTFYRSGADAGAGRDGVPVPPAAGTAAVQDQDVWHAVPPLVSGVKYVFRTEVMYATAPADGADGDSW